jgi:hypothetical protein
VRNFPVLEFHHHHVGKFHSLARGRDARQQVIPLEFIPINLQVTIKPNESGITV